MIPDQNGQNRYPFSVQSSDKTSTLWGGTYLYGLYKGAPPPLPPVQSLVVYLFLLASCLWTNASKHLPSWQVSKNSGSKGKGRVWAGREEKGL